MPIALACTPGNGPLYVSSVKNNVLLTSMTLGTVCTGRGDVSSMFVDVAATPDIEVSASLAGFREYFGGQQPLTVGTQPLGAVNRERLVIQKVVIRYSSRPAIPGLTATTTDTVPRTQLLSNETPADLALSVPLFGPSARARLEALAASNADSFQFTSTFEIHGVTEPGGSEFRTPPVSIPMTLVKTEVTCSTPNDQRLKRYSNPAQATRGCTFNGLNRRFGPGDCCLTVDAAGNPALDLSQPGCDVLP